MNIKPRFLFALALLAVSAFAVTEPIVELVSSTRPTWFQSGLYIAPASSFPLSTTANKVTKMLGGSIDYDFATSTTTCLESPAVTVTGAAVGDPCFVGFPLIVAGGGTADGGNGLQATFQCRVSAANTVLVRHCAVGTADDPPDAGYNVRVISNQ